MIYYYIILAIILIAGIYLSWLAYSHTSEASKIRAKIDAREDYLRNSDNIVSATHKTVVYTDGSVFTKLDFDYYDHNSKLVSTGEFLAIRKAKKEFDFSMTNKRVR